MKKIFFLLIFLTPNLLLSLPQLTIDLAIQTWCKEYYQPLTAQEKQIIKKYITQKSNLIESAEMSLLTSLRKELLRFDIKNFFKKYSIYYQLLRLSSILDIILISMDTQWNFSSSYSLQKAHDALISYEMLIKRPTALEINKLFDQAEDYYIERWFFLSECASCKL